MLRTGNGGGIHLTDLRRSAGGVHPRVGLSRHLVRVVVCVHAVEQPQGAQVEEHEPVELVHPRRANAIIRAVLNGLHVQAVGGGILDELFERGIHLARNGFFVAAQEPSVQDELFLRRSHGISVFR